MFAIDRKALLKHIRSQFALDWQGIVNVSDSRQSNDAAWAYRLMPDGLQELDSLRRQVALPRMGEEQDAVHLQPGAQRQA